MGSSQELCSIMDPNTAGYSEHIYCQHNKKQELTGINELQLRILTIIFKIQKDEIHSVVNIVTAL